MAFKTEFLSAHPFRLLNRSLHREIDRLTDQRLLPLLLIMFAFWIVCAVEWTQRFAGAIPDPRFWTSLSLIVTFYGGLQVFQLRRLHHAKHQTQGLRHMADILEAMRSKGFVACHNLVSEGTAIDHVVVGPAGIFTITAKLRRGSGVIDYRNDEELIFADRIKDGRPLRHARAAARAVQCQLNRHFEPAPVAKPLLVFLGDWTVQRAGENLEVEVLTAKQLENYLDTQRPEFSGQEISELVAALGQSRN